MSLYVIEREDSSLDARGWLASMMPRQWADLSLGSMVVPEVRDCNARDGEWHAVVTLPHEVVGHEGRAVPVWEGDVERREWEARRRAARP